MKSKTGYLIFTDLDNTLIDDNYSCKDAEEALNFIKEKKIPLIFCTSKTRAEIEVYRRKIEINDPFISENGGGIFMPKDYFRNVEFDNKIDSYLVIELGTPYSEIRRVIEKIRLIGYSVRGFGDMKAEEVAEISGLAIGEARLSKEREYDEPFIIENEKEEEDILKLLNKGGLSYTKGGRFYHAMGNNDKGKSVRTLTDIFRKNGFNGKTIGLGDNSNDFPMLENVDIPILIRKPDGGFADFKGECIKSKSVGPKGWNKEVLKLLS